MDLISNILNEICRKGSIYDEIMDNILPNQSKLKSELISEIAISMLENRDKLNNVIEEGWFKYWFISTVRNQVKSNTSPFYKNAIQTTSTKFKSNNLNIDIEDTSTDDIEYKKDIEMKMELLNEVKNEIKCNWFDAEMFRLYYEENKSYRQIEREYDIDHCLVFNSVSKLKKQIINKIKEKK